MLIAEGLVEDMTFTYSTQEQGEDGVVEIVESDSINQDGDIEGIGKLPVEVSLKLSAKLDDGFEIPNITIPVWAGRKLMVAE